MASKPELLRRVSVDLIGMPAPPDIRDAYLREENSISYDELIDLLIALPSLRRFIIIW